MNIKKINQITAVIKLVMPAIFFFIVTYYLQTPQVPPSFAQCLQYLQFLQAEQFLEPVHFEAVVRVNPKIELLNIIKIPAVRREIFFMANRLGIKYNNKNQQILAKS